MPWLGILDHCLIEAWENRVGKAFLCVYSAGKKILLIAVRIERHCRVEQIGVNDPC